VTFILEEEIAFEIFPPPAGGQKLGKNPEKRAKKFFLGILEFF
jgi:hypothetical protein